MAWTFWFQGFCSCSQPADIVILRKEGSEMWCQDGTDEFMDGAGLVEMTQATSAAPRYTVPGSKAKEAQEGKNPQRSIQ